MKKVITYGTYDLLHQGHINLLKRAKALGDWLIVGVTTDNFDLERGKLNVHGNVMERIEAVRETGLADQIIIEEYPGQKIDDILRYDVDIFAIGSDWEGKFDYLNEYCQVTYLPRTEGISSTMLRERQGDIRIGIVGTGSIAGRFANEMSFVSRTKLQCAYNPDAAENRDFCSRFSAVPAASYEELLEQVDAVYVASPHLTHYDYSRKALLAGKHVLCETPFVLSERQAEELYGIAEKNRLVLMVALKTAYCPAFGHLITLLKSGIIGEVVDINASVTTLSDADSVKLNPNEAGGSMSENACFPMLPIFRILGLDYKSVKFFSKFRNGVDIYTKALFLYEHGIASFQVGLGVKSEGNMIISGTNGCIYVPAPWWKTDFFEVKYEDQNRNRKFFYPYEGDGLRYEIKEFATAILRGTNPRMKLTREENLKMARIQEKFMTDKSMTTLI